MIHFDHDMICIMIHNLRYSCMQYNVFNKVTTFGVGQLVAARYAKTCDQEHHTLMATATPMGDIKSPVISNMFLCCKCEIYYGLLGSFVGFVVLYCIFIRKCAVIHIMRQCMSAGLVQDYGISIRIQSICISPALLYPSLQLSCQYIVTNSIPAVIMGCLCWSH